MQPADKRRKHIEKERIIPMKKYLAVIMSFLLAALLAVPAIGTDAGTSAEKAHISFGEDGKFTILQVADIQDDTFLSYLCKRSIIYAVKEAQPDLIVLTGDNISGPSCRTKALAEKALRDVMDVFESLGVPVAMVFGNHDDEKTPLTKLDQIEVYESYSCFIGCAGVVAELKVGDNSTMNAGTYNIPVYESADSDRVAYNVWCFDSGTYNPDPQYGGYSYVLPEQLDWYVKTSNALKEANGGKPVPSIAFQHIIPVQIFDALQEVAAGTSGAVGYGGKYYSLPDGTDPEINWLSETPCPPGAACEPTHAEINTMLRQGDVKAVFVGHDHVNNYIVPYEGIDLACSQSCSFSAYNDLHRGFRVITIDKESTDTYETHMLFTDTLLREGNTFDVVLYSIRALYDKAYIFFRDLF